MLYCTVLYYTVLHCTNLYCIVLYCTVLYYTVLHCTVLYCTVLYCTVPLYCHTDPASDNLPQEQSRDQILRLLLLGAVMLPWEPPSYFYTALARAK